MPSTLLTRSVAAVATLTLIGTGLAPVAGASQPDASAPTLRATAHTTLGARLLRRTQLRTRPGGHVVTTLATRTEYGSRRVLAVVARRGDWLAVLSDSMPNSRAGWIPAGDAALRRQHYLIDADRSARLVTVFRDGRVVRRLRVAVGMSATATPTGRYAVTDAVYFGSGPYGYGALPITGHQRNLPADRNRLAIHGTTAEASIGSAASGGCLRAHDADIRWLVHSISAGTQVRITA
jgi:lipoprotein-anchoring transpeptidase ErfK/SrfK